MKSLFALIAPAVFALTAAQAQAAPATLDCTLVGSTDWGAEISLGNGELNSISFRNLAGTIVSAPLKATREPDQFLPGFVFYRIKESAPYQLRVETRLLNDLEGRIYIQSPYIELPDDVYFCRQ